MSRSRPHGYRPWHYVLLAVLVVIAGALIVKAVQPPPLPSPGTRGPLPETEADAPTTSALWIGDSFTQGAGSEQPTVEGYAQVAARTVGWVSYNESQGGTGYLADGQVVNEEYAAIPDRLPGLFERYIPDVVIFDAGRNDRFAQPDAVKAAAAGVYAETHEAWPEARMVFVAPFLLSEDDRPMGDEFVHFLEEQATIYDGVVIDPLGEGWVSTDEFGDHLFTDGEHPDTEGHAMIAADMAQALRELSVHPTSSTP